MNIREIITHLDAALSAMTDDAAGRHHVMTAKDKLAAEHKRRRNFRAEYERRLKPNRINTTTEHAL